MKIRLALICAILSGGAAIRGLAQDSVSLGGYGELHYNDVSNTETGENRAGTLDFHRFVMFAGYAFNDWITFHSELEVEHTKLEAGDNKGGEVALEQAYIDLRSHPAIGIRAGLVLVPVGIINPVHEPPTFHGVERPNLEKVLIPTTWRESGIGIFGKLFNRLDYEAYIMAGLNPAGIDGKNGIRGGRQEGLRSSTDNLALTARMRYQVNLNLTLSASYFFSSLSSDVTMPEANLGGVRFNLAEAHVVFQKSGLEARGLVVFSALSNVAKLNAAFGNDVGESQLGGYVELAYDVLGLMAPESEQQLSLLGRFESYDSQYSTEGIADNAAFARQETTLGFTYKPMPQVAFKADYQWLYNRRTHNLRQFNLGVGYNF